MSSTTDMAAEWKQTKLGEVLGPKGYIRGPFGSALKRGELQTEGVPVYEQQHAIYSTREFRFFVDQEKYHELSRFTVRPNDLIISCSGTLGRVSIIREDDPVGVISQALLILRPDTRVIDPGFLFYILSSPAGFHSMVSVSTGSVQVNIAKRSIIEDIDVLLPPLPEQKAIATVLGALDGKIQLNQRMNATLEAMARGVFQSWFVDFDPVRAKAEGRPVAGLDEATAALFPAQFQDFEQNRIPMGWEACPLAQQIELLSGGTPKTSEPTYWDGDIPWYSVKDAPTGSDVWVIRTEKSVTREGIENSAAQVLPEGTTIISARGTVGKLAFVGKPMAMNQSCYGVRGRNHYSAPFIYFLLRHVTGELQQRTHGSVFDTITRQTFETLDFTFPPPELTSAYAEVVQPLMQGILANLHQSETIATMRDTLLPKLLSGDVRIMSSHVEKMEVFS